MELVTQNSIDAYAKDLESKLRVCKMLLDSGTLPAHLKTPQAIFAVILRGQEYGFSPLRSTELFDFIQGKACPRAAALQALAVAEGGSFIVEEESAKLCRIKAARPSRKWEQVYQFTIEQAAAMGLTAKDNWKKMPQFMLYARCVSVLARRGWPDVIGGLYSAEEIQDEAATITVVADDLTAQTNGHDKTPALEEPQFLYDLDRVPEEHREEAQLYAKGKGATLTKAPGIYASSERLKKLDPYLVEAV